MSTAGKSGTRGWRWPTKGMAWTVAWVPYQTAMLKGPCRVAWQIFFTGIGQRTPWYGTLKIQIQMIVEFNYMVLLSWLNTIWPQLNALQVVPLPPKAAGTKCYTLHAVKPAHRHVKAPRQLSKEEAPAKKPGDYEKILKSLSGHKAIEVLYSRLEQELLYQAVIMREGANVWVVTVQIALRGLEQAVRH